MMKSLNFLWDLIFPLECLGCGKEGVRLCEGCRKGIPLHYETFLGCPRCGRIQKGETFGGRFCSAHQGSLQGVFSLGDYKHPLLREMMQDFKYRFEEDFSEDIQKMVSDFLEYSGKNERMRSFFDCVVPVPLHPRRLAERGYNQATLIASGVAEYLALPLEERMLRRVQYTKPQAQLEDVERWGNVEGAFRVVDSENVRGKRILLVDDVFTTGSTLESCAFELKKAQAKSVWAFVVMKR